MATELGIGASAVGEGSGSTTVVSQPGPPQQSKAPGQLRVMVAGESGQGKVSRNPSGVQLLQ